MAIASNDDLIQRCQDWLFGRADIAARVPDFITLFEAKMNRQLRCRQMEVAVDTSFDMTEAFPELLSLPDDYQTMRRVRLKDDNCRRPLRYATEGQIDVLRAEHQTPGKPVWYTIYGNVLEALPTPNLSYPIQMVYRAYIPPLVANTSNWLLALAPDAYLYGTLMEAAPYLHEDERIAVWSAGIASAVQDLNRLSEDATTGAGPLTMRSSRRGYS